MMTTVEANATANGSVVTAQGPHAHVRRGRHRRPGAPQRLARGRRRQADRRHGAVRVRQVNAHAHPGRAGQADLRRRCTIAGHGDHDAGRHGADQAAPRPYRLRLPVLQLVADAHRRGERPAPADDRRGQAGRRVVRRAASTGSASSDRLSHRPAELSGGQQQRVAIARALVSRPTVVFADEPTGNLDSRTSADILELMRASVEVYGQTMVMVTHDARAAAMADQVLLLADGRIVEELPRSTAQRSAPRSSSWSTGDQVRGARATRPQAPDRTHRARRRARGRSGERYLRPHRLDLDAPSTRSSSSNYRNTDLAVTGKSAVPAGDNGTNRRHRSTRRVLTGSPRCRTCAPPSARSQDDAHLIGQNGKAITFGGAPNLGFSVDPSSREFNPLTLLTGAWPRRRGGHRSRQRRARSTSPSASTIGVESRGPVDSSASPGWSSSAPSTSIGGATLAGFDLATAQELFDKQGKLDQILIAAKPGVSPSASCSRRSQKILPPATQVRSGTDQAKTDARDTKSFTSSCRTSCSPSGGSPCSSERS